ncbi:hypothetical protein KY309_02500 [Candidatus Woesearchaeota archaeon]|nr:hypothetical protein [Candidatus Woesearchaeota archaeon]MBW3016456.1 hypothetical protein [Candidatus Woesearchaeota archaeon]
MTDLTTIMAELYKGAKLVLGRNATTKPAHLFTSKDTANTQTALRITALVQEAIEQVNNLIILADQEEKDALKSFKTRLERLRIFYEGIADYKGILKEDPWGFGYLNIMQPFEELLKKSAILTEMYAAK